MEVIHYPKKEPAMTHQEESAVFEAVTAIMIEHGPAAMASACSIIMNCAMQIEREQKDSPVNGTSTSVALLLSDS